MRRMKLWLLVNLVTIILISSNISSIQGATREWNAGDIYLWGKEVSSSIKYTHEKRGLLALDEIAYFDEIQYNITSIDILSERYEVIPSDADSVDGERAYYFGAEDFITDVLHIGDFIDIDYTFDRTFNQTVLFDVDLGLGNVERWFLIQPDWEAINEGFVDLFNKSSIVDLVNDFYEPIVYNMTLGDFYSNLTSFKIMGKTNFERGLEAFSTIHKWSFNMDLSNIISTSVYNSTAGYNNYYPFEKYIYTLEIEYSEGGILQSYNRLIETKITLNDFTTEGTYILEFKLGGLKSVTGNIGFYSIIGSLTFSFKLVMIVSALLSVF
ncbi:MAG: hypothetical protein ACFFDW_12235, partial [Candidatus Thorarchaeota archaeon]